MITIEKVTFCAYLIFINLNLIAQSTSDEYWQAALVAGNYYDEANYQEAVKAFDILWTKPNNREIANHRLRAAAANCMIDNEEGVRKNLFKIIDVATKTDMKRVLVNYEIFNKYKELDWWHELETRMNERLANLIAHHKNLRIFKKGRNFIYSALRIDTNGDTLANTKIHMMPDGTGWGDEAASSQSQVVYRYESTEKDSLDHIEELEIMVGGRFWNNIDTTGVIENSEEVWIHPFRNNEFYKTEIAPFPIVEFPLPDTIGHVMKAGTVHIIKNWGQYTNTETRQDYIYLGKENKTYHGAGEISCLRFSGTAENTRFGISKLEYFFNEDFGFTEMNYHTYDDDIIEFKLIDVYYNED